MVALFLFSKGMTGASWRLLVILFIIGYIENYILPFANYGDNASDSDTKQYLPWPPWAARHR
jgi:hypothetical protein